jgi:hypothetical protein
MIPFGCKVYLDQGMENEAIGWVRGTAIVQRIVDQQPNHYYVVELSNNSVGYLMSESGATAGFVSLVVAHPDNVTKYPDID